MNINELKEHLENGGKIRRPCWGKKAYIYLDDDGELTQDGGLLYYSNKDLLLDDWVIYGELKQAFKVSHTGLYKTRDGRKAYVSCVDPSTNLTYVLFGVIDGERCSRTWTKKGETLEDVENPEDIVAEWKED